MNARIHRILALMALAACAAMAQSRIRDVARLEGQYEEQLVGFGLVVGLPGTGDGPGARTTVQATSNLLRNMGLEIDPGQLRLRNVAAVMVTARLMPFSRPGSHLDVTVSSLGDARSLAGGVLLSTPLQGPDRETWALAQGPVGTGGSVLHAFGGARTGTNVAATAIIPRGAAVRRALPGPTLGDDTLRFVLERPDWATAAAMARAIDAAMGAGSAVAEDAGSVRFAGIVPPEGIAQLVARLGEIRFDAPPEAKVVVNERTGTVVIGAEVRLTESAVTHGAITVRIEPGLAVTQPAPLTAGVTAVVANPQIETAETRTELRLLPATSTVGDLVAALELLGASPRDLIAILQALERAGALRAELEVM